RLCCSAMAPPQLIVRVGNSGSEWTRLAPPTRFDARAWILWVVAAQVAVDHGRVSAQLRAHVTRSAQPWLRPLASGELVHVTLAAEAHSLPPLPRVATTMAPAA